MAPNLSLAKRADEIDDTLELLRGDLRQHRTQSAPDHRTHSEKLLGPVLEPLIGGKAVLSDS